MHPREVFESLIGDMDYDPKRGGLYLSLGAAALCIWGFTPPDARSGTIPLLFGAGSLTLILKGVFLVRKTSRGLDAPQRGLGLSEVRADPVDEIETRSFSPLTAVAAQMVQDFGAGALLISPIWHVAQGVNEAWTLPTAPVFLCGAGIFMLGWGIRRMFRRMDIEA